ncbi:MAG: TonB family protein [Candidatus Methylomirabilis sp.]|nr:TonB family protein [Candidatus Methylomirabilis sp.]
MRVPEDPAARRISGANWPHSGKASMSVNILVRGPIRARRAIPAQTGDRRSRWTARILRFASYLLGVKRRIESVWSYPREARGLTGNLIVTFGITRDGRLGDLRLTQTSGIAPLDNEAIRAIREANPFMPFPEQMRFERLNIRAAFYYHVSRTTLRNQ